MAALNTGPLTPAKIELLVDKWSHGELHETQAKGPRLVRAGRPSKAWWPLWQSGWKRKTMFAAGLSCKKDDDGQWLATWTTPVPEGWKPDEPKAEQSEAPPRTPGDDQWVRREREAILTDAPPINEAGLIPYQVPAVKLLVQALETHGAGVDASDGGVGKTYTSLAAVREFDGWQAAVVCPKPVMTAWSRVAEHIGIRTRFVLNYDKIRNGNTGWGHWKGDPKAGADFEWTVPRETILIMDEAHSCRTPESRASRMMVAAYRQQIPTLALSATLGFNPSELYSVGLMLGLHKGKDFKRWCEDNGCIHDGYGWQYRGGPLGMVKLHRQIFPHRGNRIKVEDLGDAFPETQITAEAYDCSDTEAIQAVYEEMHEELAALEKKQEADKDSVLTVLLRARQKAELLKVPMIADLAVGWHEEGYRVPVFVNFTETLLALSERLNCKCLIWGENKPGERDQFIDAFQRDEEPFILCNLQAGGVGIGLHGKRRASIISPGFSAILVRQALFRVHRQGGDKSIQRIVFAAGTIEVAACRAVQKKLDNLAALNDGDLKAGIRFS